MSELSDRMIYLCRGQSLAMHTLLYMLLPLLLHAFGTMM
jgi:hypothetical protein